MPQWWPLSAHFCLPLWRAREREHAPTTLPNISTRTAVRARRHTTAPDQHQWRCLHLAGLSTWTPQYCQMPDQCQITTDRHRQTRTSRWTLRNWKIRKMGTRIRDGHPHVWRSDEARHAAPCPVWTIIADDNLKTFAPISVF